MLPGDLQGRSRHVDDDDDNDDEHGESESRNVVPACLFETSELERSMNMLRQFPLSRANSTVFGASLSTPIAQAAL